MSTALVFVMCALTATPAATKTPPGTLIEIQATCNNSSDSDSRAVSYLVVKSPLCSILPNAVYLTNGWKYGATPNPSGMRVKFLHINDQGKLETLEGIQLRDGRVLVNGVLMERNTSAK